MRVNDLVHVRQYVVNQELSFMPQRNLKALRPLCVLIIVILPYLIGCHLRNRHTDVDLAVSSYASAVGLADIS